MKGKLKNLQLFLLFSLITFAFSCRKEMEKAHWETDILAPLVYTSMNIDNVLPDSILMANADSSMKIVFENAAFDLDMESLFKIPDTIAKSGFGSPANLQLNPGQAFPSTSSETTYKLSGVELRKVIIKSGFLSFTIKNEIKEVMDLVYSIPSAKLNGNPFTLSFSAPAAVGTSPGVYSKLIDLSGYEIALTGINNNKVNTIYYTLNASVSAQGNPVFVTTQDSLIISNHFYDIIPAYAKGYFGQTTINVGPDTTNFSMFNKITDGGIQLEDVKFDLDIENPIGLDARVYINNLSSINTKKNTTVSLAGSMINTSIRIDRATEYKGTVYPTYKNIAINKTNSNLKPFVENLPNKLGYSLQVETNPLGNQSGSNDFIYSDKLLNAKMKMEIPLSIVANDLTLGDTADFSIKKENGLENVNYGTLTLFANNGFPLDATLQMYLLDENNVITDSIFSTINTIYQAPVNSNLKVIQKKLTKLIIPVDEKKLDKLFNTKKTILKVKFNTASKPNYVKIYSNYSIDIKLVGDFNYTVQMQ